jgi:hypothetical protein
MSDESGRGLPQSKTLARQRPRDDCPTPDYCVRPNFFSNSRKFISIKVGRPCGQV